MSQNAGPSSGRNPQRQDNPSPTRTRKTLRAANDLTAINEQKQIEEEARRTKNQRSSSFFPTNIKTYVLLGILLLVVLKLCSG